MDRSRRHVLRQVGGLLIGLPVAMSSPVRLAAQTVAPLARYTRSRSGGLPGVVKQPAELVAERLVLPFDRAFAQRAGALPKYSYKPGVWREVGMAPDMGGTGERQEIGLVTEAVADWLTGGSPNNMLVQAEAHGSVPVHFPAPDGHIVNAIKYPKATTDYRGPGRGQTPYFEVSGPVVPEWAHYPSLSYVSYLATRDAYYLEEQQYAATFMIINAPPEFRGEAKARINDLQLRGLAWGLRAVAETYLITPEQVSAPLLPKAYWKQVLDNIRARLESRTIKSSEPFARNARMLISYGETPNDVGPWQNDFVLFVLGWMIWTGRFPEWRPVYDFLAQGMIARATGPLRSQAIQYWLHWKGQSDWPSLLAANGKVPTNSGNIPSEWAKSAPHYISYLRGAAKVAVMNGIAGAHEAFAYADAQAKHGGAIPLRWAV